MQEKELFAGISDSAKRSLRPRRQSTRIRGNGHLDQSRLSILHPQSGTDSISIMHAPSFLLPVLLSPPIPFLCSFEHSFGAPPFPRLPLLFLIVPNTL